MVDTSYLAAKAAPPSALKRLFDQRIVPAAINQAGRVEGVLERLAQFVRHRPATAMAAALGLGLCAATVRSGSRHRRNA